MLGIRYLARFGDFLREFDPQNVRLMFIDQNVNIHVCVHMCSCTFVHMYTCMRVHPASVNTWHKNVCIYTHTHLHTYTHIDTHIYIHPRAGKRIPHTESLIHKGRRKILETETCILLLFKCNECIYIYIHTHTHKFT